MDISLSHRLFKNIRNNRWQNDFIEQDKIGRGGFASVYKAKNCFDDQVYAVKKIKLRVNDIKKNFEQEIQRILDEAKFLAQVNHQNILRYYNSWLEATTKTGQFKPSLHIQVHKSSSSLNENPKRSSKHDLRDDDTEEEEEDANDEDSPTIIFERPEVEDEDSTTPSSKPANSGGFSKLLKKRKQSFAKVAAEQGISPSLNSNQSSLLTVKSPSPLTINPCRKPLVKECNTPLLHGETLETVTLFIQAELCGETLEDYLQKRNQSLQKARRKSLEEYQKVKREYFREALVFAKQIINGLSHIHSHKIIHRDLKPSNIFMVDKVCKIGDFGLIKRLHSFYPLAASPILDRNPNELVSDFNLDDEFELLEEDGLPELNLQKNTSEPLWANDTPALDFEDPITRSVGTRVYASPEQWQADKTNFDQRADIFSLGIIFLLLFHPTGTYMEQARIISESKEGKTPPELGQELPDIAYIIKRMLSVNPRDRPSMEVILHSLKLPIELHTELSGPLFTKKENSVSWRKKHFKLIGEKLCIFSKKEDKKAEVVYDLSEWKVQIKDTDPFLDSLENKDEIENRSPEKSNGKEADLEKRSNINVRKGFDIITIENPFQLGCAFRGESLNQTLELFKKLNRSIQSF